MVRQPAPDALAGARHDHYPAGDRVHRARRFPLSHDRHASPFREVPVRFLHCPA